MFVCLLLFVFVVRASSVAFALFAGQSVSVQLSTLATLDLMELIRSSFTAGRMQYDFDVARCDQSIPAGGGGPSIACLQYLYMAQASVLSVGCALSRCSSVTFQDGSQLTAPPGLGVFLLSCLYAPVPNTDITLKPPYSACSDTSPAPPVGILTTVQVGTTVSAPEPSPRVTQNQGGGAGQTSTMSAGTNPTTEPASQPITRIPSQATLAHTSTPGVLATQLPATILTLSPTSIPSRSDQNTPPIPCAQSSSTSARLRVADEEPTAFGCSDELESDDSSSVSDDSRSSSASSES